MRFVFFFASKNEETNFLHLEAIDKQSWRFIETAATTHGAIEILAEAVGRDVSEPDL
jgi:hypothetical protein